MAIIREYEIIYLRNCYAHFGCIQFLPVTSTGLQENVCMFLSNTYIEVELLSHGDGSGTSCLALIDLIYFSGSQLNLVH
jgi:hypothetical protein